MIVRNVRMGATAVAPSDFWNYGGVISHSTPDGHCMEESQNHQFPPSEHYVLFSECSIDEEGDEELEVTSLFATAII